MINQFLATLDNNPIAPVGFVWPSFTARAYSTLEGAIRGSVIGYNLSRENSFSRCLQLTQLVIESPMQPYTVAVDPRITFTQKSLQARFALGGIVVTYAGSNMSYGIMSLITTATTPDLATYVVTYLSSSTVSITDDLNNTVVRTFTFSGGTTNTLAVPDGSAFIQVTNATIAAGDSWNVAYQRPGANWTNQALKRMPVNPESIMTPDVLVWYQNAPSQIDKLAAIVVALGTA